MAGSRIRAETEGMVFERLSDKANELVANACSLARHAGATYVGTEHLLVAALRVADRERGRPEAAGYKLTTVEAALRARGAGTSNERHVPFSPRAKEVLEDALARGLSSRLRAVRVQDIWHACLAKPGTGARAMLADMGVGVEVLSHAGIEGSDP